MFFGKSLKLMKQLIQTYLFFNNLPLQFILNEKIVIFVFCMRDI